MTRERPGRPRARLFIALDLPAQTRAALSAWSRELIELRPRELRPVPMDSLHVTLAFLGYRYLREVEALSASVERAAIDAVSVAFAQSLAPRPARGPRFYAAEVSGGDGLAGLRTRLVAELQGAKLFEDERRAFWPHVTLCRVKSSVRRHTVIEHLPGATPELRTPVAAPGVTLYRSELRPQGARYEPLFTRSLQPA